MAETSTSDLESGRHRRLIVAGLLRASVTTAVLVTLYYVVPMNEALHLSAVIRLLVGLVVFAGVMSWEIRSILRSRYPGVQAVQALAIAAPLFLLIFASTYFLMSGGGSTNFSQSMTRTDALYFTVTTFATVGYGDITATSQLARVIVTVQMILDLLILGLGIRALLGAVKMGRERTTGSDNRAGPTSG
jgi:voltage-gated potassium channel